MRIFEHFKNKTAMSILWGIGFFVSFEGGVAGVSLGDSSSMRGAYALGKAEVSPAILKDMVLKGGVEKELDQLGAQRKASNKDMGGEMRRDISAANIEGEALKLSTTSPSSELVFESEKNPKKFHEMDKDPLIRESEGTLKSPHESLAAYYKDCQVEEGGGSFEEKTTTHLCEEADAPEMLSCREIPHIKIKKSVKDISLNVHLQLGTNRPDNQVMIHLLSGRVSPFTKVSMTLGSPLHQSDLPYLKLASTSQSFSFWENRGLKGSIPLNMSLSNGVLSLVGSNIWNQAISLISRTCGCSRGPGVHVKDTHIEGTIILKYLKEEIEEFPNDPIFTNCDSLEKDVSAGHCEYADRKCVVGAGTRIIDGVSVYKDCWEWERVYKCVTPSKNDCGQYRKAGCGEVYSRCKEMRGSTCVLKERTFQCKAKQEKGFGGKRMKCGAAAPFCLDGTCETQTFVPNDEMGSALSQLHVLGELQKDMKGMSPPQIFKGSDDRCSKNVIGFKDCCGASGGWGTDVKFASCTGEEKLLKEKRKKNQCHLVGSYCANRVLGVCVSTHTTFCCFGSKLLRAVQEQGRAQLGLGWGSAEGPLCRGFSVEELAKIDFSRLDLKEIYAEISAKYAASSIKLNKEALQKTFHGKARMMGESTTSFVSQEKKSVLEKEERLKKEKRRETLDKAAREQEVREATQRRYRA